jgi:NAD(P)-dependent dehydrogenase (short-subunit alcohol dehydrogenase family)
MRNFKDKVVVITGAGSGIGRALALAFADQGALLALNDVSDSGLAETVQQLQINEDRILTKLFDVSVEANFESFAEEIISKFGQIDLVINNAGIASKNEFVEDMDKSEFDRLIAINFWGMVYGSRVFLPYLREREEAALLNISSIFGWLGIPGLSSYSASKYAIAGFTEALQLEEWVRQSNIYIGIIYPAGVNTEIARSASGADPDTVGRFQKLLKLPPNKAAKIIMRGIKRKKRRILVGRDAHLLGWALWLSRPLVLRVLAKQYRKNVYLAEEP